jgi:ChrR Cupin-like domain
VANADCGSPELRRIEKGQQAMEINADFTQRVAVHSDALEWRASPMAGVKRRMLDRIGDEVARATSIVRYAPESHFSAHVHGGGEEFVVLDGVFQDEHGDYSAGWYIRNPPNSAHTPGSSSGCTIFVKLWQFDPDDRTEVKIDMNALKLIPQPERPGVSGALLFEDAAETVRIEKWAAGMPISINAKHGAEILVLEGSFSEGDDDFGRHDWLRLPRGPTTTAFAAAGGARVWIKTRHLNFDRPFPIGC